MFFCYHYVIEFLHIKAYKQSNFHNGVQLQIQSNDALNLILITLNIYIHNLIHTTCIKHKNN